MAKQTIILRIGYLFLGLWVVFFLATPVLAQTLPTSEVQRTGTPTEAVNPQPNGADTPLETPTPVLTSGTLLVPGTPYTSTLGPGTPSTVASGTPQTLTTQPGASGTPQESQPVPTPTSPTRTPLPAIIQVHPRMVAGQFIQAFLIGVGGIGLAWLAKKIIYNVLARVHPEIQILAARFAFIAILLAAVLWILSVFHVNSATLATVLGSLGLALSLSAHDLFKNLVAGIYLLLERPFVVVDTITIGRYTGQVAVVDLRTITLRTEDQELVIVPNTLVMSQIVVRKVNVNSPVEPDTSPDETSS